MQGHLLHLKGSLQKLALTRRLLQANGAQTTAHEGLQCALDWLLTGQGAAGSTAGREWRGWSSGRCLHSTGYSSTAEPALAFSAAEATQGKRVEAGAGAEAAWAEAAAGADRAGAEADLASQAGANGRPSLEESRGHVFEAAESKRGALAKLRELVKTGDVKGCLESLEPLTGRQAQRVYNWVLGHSPPGTALRAHQDMLARGIPPNTDTGIYLVRAYKAEGRMKELDEAMASLLERNPSVAHWSLFMSWANAHAEAGNPEGVRRVMRAVQQYGLELTAHYWSLYIRANYKGRRCSRPVIDKVFEEMGEAGVKPTEEVYRAAIYNLGALGHARRAGEVFQRMVEAGIQPKMPSYSALINAYAEGAMPDQAVQTFRAMHRAGVKANHQTYAALMKAFARVGDVERARAVLTTMRWDGLEPNPICYGLLIETCVTAKSPREARRALDAMLSAGLSPSEVHYTALLSAYAAVGDVVRSKAVLKEMREAGVEPNMHAYTVVMQLLGNQGLPAEAQAVFEEALAKGLKPDRITYGVLLDSYLNRWARGGRSQGRLLQRAQRFFQNSPTLQPELDLSHPNTVKLDLHGYSTWGAQLAVLSVLQQLLEQYRANKRFAVPSLQIVTGRGNRSTVRNKSPTREATLSLLQPLVPVRLGSQNDGLLIVVNAHLLRLLGFMDKQRRSFSLKDMQQYLVEP